MADNVLSTAPAPAVEQSTLARAMSGHKQPKSVRAAGLRRRFPCLDSVIRSRQVQGAIKTKRRWSAINDPVRFALTQLFGPRGQISVHDVLSGRAHIVLRHKTRDVEIFDEIFVGVSIYEPPPVVAAILRDRPPRNILDLGGNVGLFGAYALAHWPAATITSVEPDPENLQVLQRCVAANTGTQWTIVAACAARREGIVGFCGGRFADSATALDGEVATTHVATVDAFGLLATADFVKIDIEGGEWALLLDPRFADVEPLVVVIEWHERGCPAADAHALASDALRHAGYQVEGQALGYDHGTLWAWRP